MISLRSFGLLAVVAVALTSVGCSDATTTPVSATRVQVAGASLSASVTTSALVDARVFLDKSGTATLEVHTGAFDDRTNTGTANGTFSSLQYTVTNSSKKQVLSKSVNFSTTGVTKYSTFINLCSSSTDDDDDDDGHSSYSSSCSTHIGAGWTVSVQGTLKGVGGGDKKTDIGTVNASIMNLPDVDLTQQGLFLVDPTGAQTPATATVAASVPTTFSVSIPNNKPIAGVANAIGVQTACIVMVDGWPQLPLPNGQYNKYTNPNAFGYVNDAITNIAAGAIGSCQFKLSLPTGAHKIVVNATVLSPGDFDNSNNSTTTFTVTAGVVAPPVDVPVDVAAQSLQRVGNGVSTTTLIALDTATIGKTTTFKASFVNASTRATAVNCAVTADASLNIQPVGATTNVAIAANGGVGVCQYTALSNALGTFPITVTATPTSTSPADPNAANNAVSGTLSIKSTGGFTDVHGTFNVYQDWSNPINGPAWPIATSLDHQVFQVSQLSLLIVPSQAILGTFSLKATTTSASGAVSFGTGTVPAGSLRAAGPGETVCLTVGPAASLGNAAEPGLVYFAQVCTQQAAQPGFQQISVNYTQSVGSQLPAAPSLLLFTSNVTMKLQLDFTLVGSTPDKVTATVAVPVTTQAGNCTLNIDSTAQSCSTTFGAPVVTTP
jgi:hypothetical protein